jgi:hypothetical protein
MSSALDSMVKNPVRKSEGSNCAQKGALVANNSDWLAFAGFEVVARIDSHNVVNGTRHNSPAEIKQAIRCLIDRNRESFKRYRFNFCVGRRAPVGAMMAP